MPITFPKSCRTAAQKSAHASYVARVGWAKLRKPQSVADLGYIEFGGALAAAEPMRMDIRHRSGAKKWEAWSGCQLVGPISERGVLRTVKVILRMRRYTEAPV
jgi:hypothetical protein